MILEVCECRIILFFTMLFSPITEETFVNPAFMCIFEYLGAQKHIKILLLFSYS